MLWLLLAVFFVLSACKKKENTDDYSPQFKIIYNNVNALFDKRKDAQGIHYLDTAFKRIKNPHLIDFMRAYALRYHFHHKVSHNFAKGLLYADSMLMMVKKDPGNSHYLINYAEANFNRGDAYTDLAQYNEAYQCFYQGYYIGKSTLKDAILAEYTYRMGMVLYKQRNYLGAADYFKKSNKQAEAYGDNFASFYQRQELLNDIGESYKSGGKIDSARVYYDKALAYIIANASRFQKQKNLVNIALGVCYGNQGEIDMFEGKNKQAKALLQKSVEINGKSGNDNYNAELVSINLGKLYIKTGDYKSFLPFFIKVRKQLDTAKNQEAETDWNRLMSNYYYDKKDVGRAFKYLQDYNSLKDSINKQTSAIQQTNVEQQQANYDKQYQIVTLQNNNRQEHIYIYLAVAFAVLALVIIALIYRNWKISKGDVKIYSTLNQQITQQKTNLEHTLVELNKSSQEKDQILRTVAHDLRNPIGGIASLTMVMAEEDYTDEQKEMINLIRVTSQNSLELINEILEVTHNGLTPLNKEMVEINSLLTNSVELLRFKAAEKDQQIQLEVNSAPQDLLISREKIWRVLSNLISNAIKFSARGGNIYAKIVNYNEGVEISVRDTGIGIPEGLKNKIFNMFTEAQRPGTSGEKSFGLGLSIIKKIIESHQGKIWFESEDGIGTTFFVRLQK